MCVFLDATTSFLLLKTTGNKGNGNSNNNTSKYEGPKLCLPICHSCNVVHGLCMYVIVVIPFWCCCMYQLRMSTMQVPQHVHYTCKEHKVSIFFRNKSSYSNHTSQKYRKWNLYNHALIMLQK